MFRLRFESTAGVAVLLICLAACGGGAGKTAGVERLDPLVPATA